MPAVSKAQQKFFGIVRAIQKGEMAPTTPETAKAAADMKKKDVKDFASTKHKGLPDKKVAKEAYYGGEEQRKKDEKKKKIDAFMDRAMPKRTFDQMGRETDRRTGKLKEGKLDPKVKRSMDDFFRQVFNAKIPHQIEEEDSYSQKNKILKKAKPLHKHLYKNLHKGDTKGDVNEESNPRIPSKKGQPANSRKHSDLYTDENPKGTIHGLGFKDVATAKASVSKIRNSSRSHAHKIQAAVAMEQRAREMGKTSEAAVYRKYINSMKKKTKKMNEGYTADNFNKLKEKIGSAKKHRKPAVDEGWSDKYKKSIDCSNPKGFSQRAHCQGKKKVSEESKYDRYDKEKKQFAKDDRKMKFGKFYDKAKEARDRLRPGEVKRYDKKLGKYVSNKD